MQPLIDPRPLESPAYWEQEPSGLIDYSVTEFQWNKETRKIDKKVSYYTSKIPELLEVIAGMLRTSGDSQIEVDASQYQPLELVTTPMHYNVKISDFTGMHWQARWLDRSTEFESIYEEEDGTDNSELLATVEWLCNECKGFLINVSPYDPTP